MEAKTLNCLMCGAPSRCDATKCAHCGARLAAVACASCFGMIFQGARFCAHCGSRVARGQAQPTNLPCPKCKTELHYKQIGCSELHECDGCHGLWIEVETFERICADREKQSTVLGTASDLASPGARGFEAQVRYVPCPVCQGLMHRVNFAKCSGVIIDVCRAHGTWFDKDELHRIVRFIHGGGLDQARQKELAEMEAATRRLQNKKWEAARSDSLYGPSGYGSYGGGFPVSDFDLVSMAGSILSGLFRR